MNEGLLLRILRKKWEVKKINGTAILLLLFLLFFLIQTLGQENVFCANNNLEKKTLKGIQSGERLEFSISWMGINAGNAILEIGDPINMGSNKAFPITSIARSNDFISKFFPVEDRVKTYMDAEKLLPLKFIIHQREGKRVKNREVQFDQINHKVRQIEEGKEERYDVDPGTQDALSVLYYFRTLDFPPPGESSFIKVYEGGKNWDLEIKVLGKETVDTLIGSYQTIKTVAMARFEGVFLNKGDIIIWFTDDSRHIPVQMKSQVVIGAVTALLVSEENETN